MVATDLDLHRMVDLSLRTPEVGVVNFNQLHKLLHAILNHIGLNFDGQNVSKVSDFKVVIPQVSNGTLQGSNFETTADATVSDGADTLESLPKDGRSQGEGTESPTTEYASDSTHAVTTTSNAESKIQDQELERMKSHQRHLENKISNLEDKLKLLDELPSNKSIIENAQLSDSTVQSGVSTKENPLSGIWQFMKINSRLQAAETAIDRIMSILNEFLGSGKSVGELSDNMQDLAKELASLKSQVQAGQGRDTNTVSSNEHRDALKRIGDLQNRINGLASKDDLKEYVKWPALEDALNVRKGRNKSGEKKAAKPQADIVRFDDSGRESNTPEEGRPKTVPVKRTQTPIPPPEVPKTAMTRSEFTQVTTTDLPEEVDDTDDGSHPSPELVECLRQIGELSDKNTKVEEQVQAINEVLPNKIDKHELDLPEDLKKQLEALQAGLNALTHGQGSDELDEIKRLSHENREKIENIKRELTAMARQAKQAYIERPSSGTGVDNEAMDTIRSLLKDVQEEQSKTSKKIEYKVSELLEDLNQKQEHIEALYNYVQKIQDTKADKDNVAMEMDVKADKTALDGKVSMSTFDTTFNMLDEGLREALQKMDDYMNEELALKQALKQLSCDMKEKMDGQAFKAMQDYLERRIADVQKSRTMIAREAKVDLTGAAGIRRPLLNFHCISCNRPVDVNIDHKIRQALPSAQGVKVKRSKGPYISYEIEQIRHFQRAQQPSFQPADKSLSEFVANRPCGGSHTIMSHTLRKPARIVSTQMSQVLAATAREESPAHVPNWTRDMSVIDLLKGSDGHIYKGRYKQIPPISRKHKHTPSESDLPQLHRDAIPPMSGPRWNSDPQLSRGNEFQSPIDYAPLQVNKEPIEPRSQPCTTPPPSSTNISPGTKMKRIVTRHASSDQVELVPAPSPSPPAARENEYQHRIDREDFLKSQQQLSQQQQQQQPQPRTSPIQRLFSPRHQRQEPHPTPTDKTRVPSPSSTAVPPATIGQRPPENSGNLEEPINGRLSVDSVDDVIE